MSPDVKTVVAAILSGSSIGFSYHGRSYLIQEENNKGWSYLSLWRTAPGWACLCRAFFDAFDGVSEETVRELFAQPFSDGHTVGEIIRSPDTVWEGPG